MKTEQTLTKLIDSVSEQLSTVSSLKNKAAVLQTLENIQVATSSTANWLAENKKRKFIATRKVLVAISNSVEGMHSGVTEGDIKPAQLKELVNKLQTRFVSKASATIETDSQADQDSAPVVELTEAQEKTKIVLEKSLSSADWQASLKEIQNAIVKKKEEVANEERKASETKQPLDRKTLEIQTALAEVDASIKRLPATLKSAFSYTKAPVTPIIQNIFGSDVYAKSGIAFIDLEGYVILPNQLMLTVSKKVSEKNKLTPLAYAQTVLTMMNERGTENYNFVSETGKSNPRNTDIMLFWVMPTRKLQSFMKYVGRNLKTMTWGIPTR